MRFQNVLQGCLATNVSISVVPVKTINHVITWPVIVLMAANQDGGGCSAQRVNNTSKYLKTKNKILKVLKNRIIWQTSTLKQVIKSNNKYHSQLEVISYVMIFVTLYTLQNGFIVTEFLACPLNTYGDQCLSKCGHCVGNITCNPEDGVCPEGCRDGYIGNKCNQIEKFDHYAIFKWRIWFFFYLKIKFSW